MFLSIYILQHHHHSTLLLNLTKMDGFSLQKQKVHRKLLQYSICFRPCLRIFQVRKPHLKKKEEKSEIRLVSGCWLKTRVLSFQEAEFPYMPEPSQNFGHRAVSETSLITRSSLLGGPLISF